MSNPVTSSGYTCKDCGAKVVFSPTLKERGMTNAEGKSIFYDRTGGRCHTCFMAYRNTPVIKITRALREVT